MNCRCLSCHRNEGNRLLVIGNLIVSNLQLPITKLPTSFLLKLSHNPKSLRRNLHNSFNLNRDVER